MTGDTDPTDRPDDDGQASRASETDGGAVDRALLSDLSVNAVPIVVIAASVLGFLVLSGREHDPLLLFHGALVGGIVFVSAVAGWVVAREDAPLEGSAADAGEEFGDD